MGSLRGLAIGVLGLTLTDAILSTDKSAQNAGAIVTGAAGIFNRLVDVSVPLIPDLRVKKGSTPGLNSPGGLNGYIPGQPGSPPNKVQVPGGPVGGLLPGS